MSAYREARSIIENLLAETQDAEAAARYHLLTHCANCGTPVVGSRQFDFDNGVWCELCNICVQSNPIAASHPISLPTNPNLNVWPRGSRALVDRVWGAAPIQQLVAGLAARGVAVPVLQPDGRPAGAALRRRFYTEPGVRELLAQSARAGAGVRHMAGVLFGAPPGRISDEIGHQIDEVDPLARGKQPLRLRRRKE